MRTEKICPYPGLRPFNEEESIFFRGREEHIEKIISQLEEKKFLMLTGASGDGKSSIVYAGVIPNARAGFFKAKFNNWLIADFRPERSPLQNMAVSLAEKLGYSDVDFVRKEIGYGFSSLINLYKKSQYHINYQDEKWKNADEAERKRMKRKGANLFILVDQFEEFFTNTENYYLGKSSADSQAVINLLLETAKIALAEDLPIYIICTMRSDYIGQCATFRGLPEYIGFSQFFVPRLKRKEIHQVIEEPATLNGDKISNRLTETLINEVGEGFDQLPVLQHALNSLWHVAENGTEEMDLVHLAMIAGISENNIPENDKIKFNNWLSKQPEFYRKYYVNHSLETSLSANTNILYETAHIHYNKKHQKEINQEDAQLIIKMAFQSLTKIDDSRSVRNRVTLQEITDIINKPEITTEMVRDVLNIYREQGNFLKPFVTNDPGTLKLSKNTVLDITHESLIRTWDKLKQWVDEEAENWNNYLDFKKQVDRWLKNGRKKTYLLGKGPLAFFESWFNMTRPNKFWLMKYDERNINSEEKLKDSEKDIKNAEEFLIRSKNVFKRKKYWTYGTMTFSVLWALFWLGYLYVNQKEKAEAEKKKADKLATEVLFDKINPKVIAPSSYIMSGNEYTADIFIAASSSQLKPTILIGKLDSLGSITNVTDTVNAESGIGTYRKMTEGEGMRSYQGVIRVKNPNGTIQDYPFSQEYMVARPSMAITPTKMNILYAGLGNPLDISVGGVAPADVDVTSSRGKVVNNGNGHYIIKVDSVGNSQIRISVGIKSKTGMKNMGSMEFRVNAVPSPSATFAGIDGDGIVGIDELRKAAGLIPKVEGFVFDLRFPVISWRLTTNIDGHFVHADANGPAITNEQRDLLKKAKKGTHVIIENVWVLAPEGKRKIHGCSLEVK
jgi:hypothetical protein